MSKFTSKCLSLTLLLFVIGLAFLLVAGFSGGFEDLKNSAEAGKSSLNILGFNVEIFNFNGKKYTGTGKSCDITVDDSQHARFLSIEGDATNVKILRGDDANICIEGSNVVGDVTATMEGSKCVIENSTGFDQFSIGGSSYSEIIVYVPRDMELEGIDVDLGAGELEVSDIIVGTCDMDMGAGNVVMTDVVCDTLDVDCGAGNFTFTGSIKKSGDFDMAAGNLDMTLDNYDDCNFKIEAALGHVKVGDDSYDSIGVDIEKNHKGATSTITVDASVGSVIIK